ncbi:hypothetical protein PybrP1_008135 [[Pythium] brassicae (nom. inval.)]|nr:hypothetical protein PybrP1_008135 [[Pythium] brassicae (nom. inval.)]
MINATSTTIDAAGTQAPFNRPSIAAGANKNITAQLGRSCFKEFGVPAAATDCRIGQFTIASTTAGQVYYLKEPIVTSGSTCPLMVASSYAGAPLAGRLGTGTELNVAYGAISNAFSNKITAHSVPQYQSPMDSAPGTLQPGSAIRNLQVQIGGENVFNDSKEYDFSSFKDEISKLASINGDLDNRLNCDMLNEAQWSYANRILVADVSRMTHKDVPASVAVSGIVGSSQGSNILVLVVYQRELEHDVLSGEVVRVD